MSPPLHQQLISNMLQDYLTLVHSSPSMSLGRPAPLHGELLVDMPRGSHSVGLRPGFCVRLMVEAVILKDFESGWVQFDCSFVYLSPQMRRFGMSCHSRVHCSSLCRQPCLAFCVLCQLCDLTLETALTNATHTSHPRI